MSTPAIRAIRCSLSLALLVTGVLADDHDAPVTTDHLALVAHLLDARLDLHLLLSWSPDSRATAFLVPVGDATSGAVVGGQLHLAAIPRHDAEVVTAHGCR